MVGLSIVLEEGEGEGGGEAPVADPCHRCRGRHLNAIANMSMLINNPVAGSSSSSTPSSPSPASSHGFRPAFPVADFLDQCFLCRTKLSPGKDIYMYRGDRGFCSEECRCRQILLEEEEEEEKEAFRKENQNKNQNQNRSIHCSSSVHPPSSSRNSRRGSRNRASGGV